MRWYEKPVEEKEADIEGREARCAYCKTVKPSDLGLAFFEFCGEASDDAKELCKHCMYKDFVHDIESKYETVRKIIESHDFEPKGAREYDRYYCGCRGWD